MKSGDLERSFENGCKDTVIEEVNDGIDNE